MIKSRQLSYKASQILAMTIFVTVGAGCGNSGSSSSGTSAQPAATPAVTQPTPSTQPTQTRQQPRLTTDDTQQPRFDQDAPDDGQADFDPYKALDGQGQWVDVSGERYFRPDITGTNDEDGWQPYQHGYWSYDVDQSWTWVSYDQWGVVTDHYGIWRHHERYGWIWLPFKERKYRAHVVTWFDDGDYVGWYPYCQDYPRGYIHGKAQGFDDGYWDGFNAAVTYRQGSFTFHLGFTVVNRADVTQPNIVVRRVRDPRLIVNVVGRGFSGERIRLHRVGNIPGGDREHAFEFIQAHATVQAPTGRVRIETLVTGGKILNPFNNRQLPQDEQQRRAHFQNPSLIAQTTAPKPVVKEPRALPARTPIAKLEPKLVEPKKVEPTPMLQPGTPAVVNRTAPEQKPKETPPQKPGRKKPVVEVDKDKDTKEKPKHAPEVGSTVTTNP